MKKITKNEFINIICQNKSVLLGVYTQSFGIDVLYDYVVKNDLNEHIRTCKARSKDLVFTLKDGSKSYLNFYKGNEFFFLEKEGKIFLVYAQHNNEYEYTKYLYYYIVTC